MVSFQWSCGILTITIYGLTITVEKIASTVKIVPTKTAATTTFVEEIEVFDRITAYIQNENTFDGNILIKIAFILY